MEKPMEVKNTMKIKQQKTIFLLWSLFLMCCTGAWASDADSLTMVRYDFSEPLGSEWEYIQEPVKENYVIHDGMLRLYSSVTSLKDESQPTFVGLRPDSTAFTITTKIALADLLDGDETGLAVYQAPMGYAQCCFFNLKGDRRVRVRLVLKNLTTLVCDRSVGIPSSIWLRVQAIGRMYSFSYSTDGKRYHWLDSIDKSLLRPVVVGQGNGILVGLYSYMGNPKTQAGRSFADYDEIEYLH